ncbi:50S ribosomal protein L14 [Candidatus Amesbacteria bacterium RIFCSPLOWO2_02_FULL_48_11]|uniref:Large ribosomal subunit protein uL14 n=6 Tax=Microgenomates group TaxID=1794810 RepID=A0A0H4TM49_9BACT|nr:50S ribosomal protein L14, large subunit ribosomal protein L14 [uncultured Microgenomates bacterium Rifle_16ft_4_minimus_21028]KKU56904.1 MAG: 50S ribosomal protein L14 [Candidatus Amesbacteria bacterium GW2011_GWA2_47_11]KKU94853.1 MAG: 50S ribosomal protein L14 [Candidatus Amesbacteria bacterium GW2011_GWC1_48_10]KKW01041.1 MAG: 50S ribosomal protein L14 [Candidatus Amesbacteria bacterium GW2011_GWA1_48_9]OGC89621.1 MAG: 50S ribosomal protein L14 [Candidatus Amesbacteria bacterium RBG_19FT
MIQLRSILTLADNCGAKRLLVIGVMGGWKKTYGYLGDIVTAVVDQADPIGVVKDSEIVKAVIVRTRKEKGRKDGSYIRFDDNAAVVIDPKTKDPRGTRIFGPIAREVKEAGFNKIASLAAEVL